jgi:4-hydroxythreonine-4-phosphate dehydrogenase
MLSKRHSAPLVISMGDPAGIGAEVILKSAAQLATRGGAPALAVIGDLETMRATARRLGSVPVPTAWRPGARMIPIRRGLGVYSPSASLDAPISPGHPTIQGAKAAYRYVVEGAAMAIDGRASALITGPVNKEWLNRAGHRIPGHSELLARMSHTRLWRMMFAGGDLRLALVTGHMRLAQVSRVLKQDRVFKTIALLAAHLRREMGIAKPRIAVLGFNPHAGENGLFGDEEIRAIAPAIKQAIKRGIDAYGPLPPDTAFIRLRDRFDFDAAVAMYHDQGLIALKTLEFDRAVNITLGLPFVRTSPDHGTAFDIAGKGIANPSSMIAAIDYASRAVDLRGSGLRKAA